MAPPKGKLGNNVRLAFSSGGVIDINSNMSKQKCGILILRASKNPS